MITKSKTVFSMVVCACAMVVAQTTANAAAQKSAHVSQVIQDVKLLPSNASPRPASVNDTVDESTAVRTGTQSRAELTFADFTITRLGANTVFTLGKGARELNLSSGSVLVEVPSKGAPVRINTAAVTAAISGGTAMFAVGPPIKFMVLEGTGTFYPNGHPEQAVTLHGGEMVTLTPNGQVSGIITFDVKTVLETSHLIIDFPELANLPLILDVVNQQVVEQAAGPPNPPPSKDSVVDVIDVVSQNVTANPAVQTFTATPSPPPPPPGPPLISSPVPYVINSGTVIVTHPTITTNGVADVGLLYRGSALDGPVSKFAFGSTSAFDIASGFDIQLDGKSPAAGFKFTSLQLTGNPTIDTTNGPTDLGLIAINGITSGAPGGTITFAGLKGVLLAAQDGSVNLGSEISFSGFHDLNIYARGANSDLTLGSDISTTSKVRLFAERDLLLTSTITTDDLYVFVGRNVTIGSDPAVINAPTITLSAGQDLTWNGQTSNDETASDNSGDVTISAGQAINISSDLSITRHNGGVGSGLNLSLSAGTDLTAGGSLTLAVDNSADGSLLDTGGNIALTTGGNLTVNGANGINLSVTNTGETINNGGNINLMVGATTTIPMVVATATTQAVELFVDSSGLGTIGTGGNVTFQTVGAVMLDGALGMEVDTYNGGSINNGANITAHFGGDFTMTAGQFHSLNFFLVNGSAQFGELGGTIGTGGNINVTFDHNVQTNGTSANGAFAAAIFNDGGSITTGGNISASIAGNLSAGNVLEGFITNDQGMIGTGGNITFHINGDVTEAGHTFFQLFNEGGTINSNPVIDFSAHSLAVSGGNCFTNIDNSNGGTIGGSAVINFGLTGDFAAANNATFVIDNSNGGSIGGNATINMNVSGTATVTGNATVQILGDDPAGSAAINFNGGSYSVGGTFLSSIDGNGTITFNNASIAADVVKIGAFGTNGTLTIGGGAINANTLLKLYAPGSNGTIDFVANVTLNNQSAAVLIAANKVTIFNGVVVTIGGNGGAASVFANIPNYTGSGGNGSTTGTFGGNGATTQPLGNAPTFGIAPAAPSSSGTASAGTQNFPGANVSSAATGGGNGKSGNLTVAKGKTTGAAINLSSSSQLLSLLDSAVPGPSGKITIPASKSASNSSNSINTGGRLNADRGTVDAQHVRDRPVTNSNSSISPGAGANNAQSLASTRALAP